MFPADSKIMVVDDSSFARTIVKNSLKELKYWKILEADNAKSAQDLFQEEEQKKDRVHLLICDIHMPNMNGIELLKWVRATESWKDLPVIILTSSQEKAEILEAGKLGASHFLIKPFDTAVLRDRLASTWTKHGEKWAASLKG
jgi:two-component system chemotaxis response regulator CheY